MYQTFPKENSVIKKCRLKRLEQYEKDLNERYEIAVNKSLLNIFNNASAPIIVDNTRRKTTTRRGVFLK